MTATFERIARRTAQSEIVLQTTAPLNHDSLEVRLPTDFVEKFDVASTSPRSTIMRASTQGITYFFEFDAEREGEIRLMVKPRAAGIVNSTLRAGDGTVDLRLLVLP